MPENSQRHPLYCHSLTPLATVRSLEASISWHPDGGLSLFYQLAGDIARLRIPSPLPPDRCDGLWEHTCFEAFVALPESTAYREFNFSPSGQWAAYAFTGYRQREARPLDLPPPQMLVHQTAGRLELAVRLGPSTLPDGAATVGLRIGLSAVVESADVRTGEPSYWALRHPVGRPDFHHPDSFAAALPPETWNESSCLPPEN